MIYYDDRDFFIDDTIIKKNKLILKKVTFDLFTEVIFIPRYSTDSYNKLWWNVNEIGNIRINANFNEIKRIKEYRMKNLQQLNLSCQTMQK